MAFFSKVSAAIAFLISAASLSHAQNINASAEISGQAAGGGLYSYNIALHNGAASGSPIQTFWYSWVPGQDFLPSYPASLQPPPGWTAYVSGGPYYDPYYGYYYPNGYSIEFYTSTAPLNPGSSLNFGFTSGDSPAALAGTSPYYPGTPVGTSWVYSNVGYGNSAQFIVQSVPEPACMTVLLAGSLGCLVVRRGFRTRR